MRQASDSGGSKGGYRSKTQRRYNEDAGTYDSDYNPYKFQKAAKRRLKSHKGRTKPKTKKPVKMPEVNDYDVKGKKIWKYLKKNKV